ncbi:hypothetical protein [Algibacter aquimarinus]|uniref:Uncharacterized protein n=1 Tax=Algibacter aquimarinus TaxID=1136748 RepID=A0ABP9GZ32_9FLAO
MKDKVDKYLEEITNKVIKEAAVESPSFNFTNSVMAEVNMLNQSKSIVYKPLISKYTWGVIFAVFIALLVYIVFFSSQTEVSPRSNWFNAIDFSVISNNKASNAISNFSIPKVFAYAIILFGGMLCIQVPLLKYHFNKRLEI